MRSAGARHGIAAQDDHRHARFLGGEDQPATGGKVVARQVAPGLQHDRAQPAAARGIEPCLQKRGLVPRFDKQQPGRIDAQSLKPFPVKLYTHRRAARAAGKHDGLSPGTVYRAQRKAHRYRKRCGIGMDLVQQPPGRPGKAGLVDFRRGKRFQAGIVLVPKHGGTYLESLQCSYYVLLVAILSTWLSCIAAETAAPPLVLSLSKDAGQALQSAPFDKLRMSDLSPEGEKARDCLICDLRVRC